MRYKTMTTNGTLRTLCPRFDKLKFIFPGEYRQSQADLRKKRSKPGRPRTFFYKNLDDDEEEEEDHEEDNEEEYKEEKDDDEDDEDEEEYAPPVIRGKLVE